MIAYRSLCEKMNYKRNQIFLIENGQESESKEDLAKILQKEIAKALSNQKGTVTNRVYVRRIVGDVAERYIFKKFHSQPLVLPVVIEV